MNSYKRKTSGQVWKGTGTGLVISLESLKIRSGRAGRREAALQALQQGNVYVGFTQETKLMQGIHARHCAVYDVCATEAGSRHQGVVAVV